MVISMVCVRIGIVDLVGLFSIFMFNSTNASLVYWWRRPSNTYKEPRGLVLYIEEVTDMVMKLLVKD